MNTNDFDFQNENIFNIGLPNTPKSKLQVQSLNFLSNGKQIPSEHTLSGTELHTPSIYIASDATGNNTIQKDGFKWN